MRSHYIQKVLTVTVPEADPAVLAGRQNQMAAHVAAVVEQFGDSLAYNRERVVNEARFYMAQSAEAMLEAGKRLILLKENEPHGEFVEIAEQQLRLNVRTAQRMMAASLKYLSPALQAKATALSHLGKTKLLELMTEDDEELAALTEGGTVAGMTLDEIDRMTSRELRAALREAHDNAQATARVMADKNSKIDELATKLSSKKQHVEAPAPDALGAEIRSETSRFAFEAESVVRGKLRAGFQKLSEHNEAHGIPHEDFMAGLLCQLEQAVSQLRGEFDIKAAPANAASGWPPSARTGLRGKSPNR